MPTSAADLGLSADLLHALERRVPRVRRPVAGRSAGQRRSTRLGAGVEFADFRPYVAGDDFRRVDWSAYGRLDRLVLRLYLGEEDLALTLWIDASASMRWGRPLKATMAATLAGALAYAGLAAYDRVAVVGFADRVLGRLPAVRGRRSCARVWDAIGVLREPPNREPDVFAADAAGTDFGVVARAARSTPRGLSVVLSDFLTTSDPAAALAALRRAGQEVVLLQMLAPQEIDPDLTGDVALRDVETGDRVEVTLTEQSRAAYRSALAEHTERLQAMAAAHGAAFLRVASDAPPRRVLLEDMRRAGVLA